ncbi:MAG TPA: PhoH family protein, partial [Burkholderiaceae bacterium]|nr:PhoH family protein [Burkholderiaceae bacterium]
MILRHVFTPADNKRLSHLCGGLDDHLRQIEAAMDVRITRRGEAFRIDGHKAAAEHSLQLLQSLYDAARKPIAPESLQLALLEATQQLAEALGARKPRRAEAVEALPDAQGVVLRTRRADLAGRTPNQHGYLRNILNHDITFGLGPAGTGKTFLAVACAVDALERSQVQRIILTRPAVEAGERLGFLPGDLTQKVDPYLRPLYDALDEMMPADKLKTL